MEIPVPRRPSELIDLGPGSNVCPVGALRTADRPEIISPAPGHFADESVFPSSRCHLALTSAGSFLDVTGSHPKRSPRGGQADFRIGWADFFAFADPPPPRPQGAGYLVPRFFRGLFPVFSEWVSGAILLYSCPLLQWPEMNHGDVFAQHA